MGDNFSVKALGLFLRDDGRAQRVLAGRSHMHGEQIVDRLRLEACLIEFAQDGRDVLEATCGGVHGGSPAQFQGAAFAVASDTKMGAQAFQRGLDFVLECQWGGVLARCCPDLDLAGLQF